MTIKAPMPVESGKKEKKSGPSFERISMVEAGPPKAMAAATGTYSTVKNIMVPWIRSVKATAEKPPRKV